MLKAVLIDDERPAIRELEFFLKKYPMIKVSGTYTNPVQAIEELPAINPQLVFLDINMPQLQGIDAASQILERCPDTDIVFVTAYDNYAIEAFELHALDYLLKPLSAERFQNTVHRVLAKNQMEEKGPIRKLKIKCLGPFQIGWEGLEPIKWRTEKTRELFAFLLHQRGQMISKDVLIDTLWVDNDLEKAVHQLHNGIYYIRRTLNEYGIDRSLIKITGTYCLQLGDVELDVEQFQEQYDGLTVESNSREMESTLALYTGEYFQEADWNWAELERKMAAEKYWDLNVRLAKKFMESEEFPLAEKYLMITYNQNPIDENTTLLLLELYKITNDRIKAAVHFQKHAQLLKEELGIKPGVKAQKLYRSFE